MGANPTSTDLGLSKSQKLCQRYSNKTNDPCWFSDLGTYFSTRVNLKSFQKTHTPSRQKVNLPVLLWWLPQNWYLSRQQKSLNLYSLRFREFKTFKLIICFVWDCSLGKSSHRPFPQPKFWLSVEGFGRLLSRSGNSINLTAPKCPGNDFLTDSAVRDMSLCHSTLLHVVFLELHQPLVDGCPDCHSVQTW